MVPEIFALAFLNWGGHWIIEVVYAMATGFARSFAH
jgi:hypothetical protein